MVAFLPYRSHPSPGDSVFSDKCKNDSVIPLTLWTNNGMHNGSELGTAAPMLHAPYSDLGKAREVLLK